MSNIELYTKSVFRVFSTIIVQNNLMPWLKQGGNATGTCFVIEINKKKYYITNYHVVERAKLIEINNKKETLLYYSYPLDIAIISCSHDDCKPLQIGQAGTGDKIKVLGFPLEPRSLNSSNGIITRFIKKKWMNTGKILAFQIDAHSNPGNSGGPVINELGDVCGVLFGAYLSHMTDIYIIPYFSLDYVIKLFKNGESMHYMSPKFHWQNVDKYMDYEGKVLINNKILVSNIEGIPIGDEGQISIGDFLKRLGYNARGIETISFQYLIPYLNKKSVIFDKYELPLNSYSYETSDKIDYILYGDFVFVPLTFATCFHYNVWPFPINEGPYVYIAYSILKKYRKKVLNITWGKFLKLLENIKKTTKIPLYADSWVLHLQPSKDKSCSFLFS